MSASNTNRSIIILVNTLFYPARRNGMSVRYFPLVRGLVARGYTVDVLVINKYREDYSDADIRGLEQYCRLVDIIEPAGDTSSRLRQWLTRVRNVAHLLMPFGRPYELIDNRRGLYLAELQERLSARETYDVGIGVSVGGNNADLLLALPRAIRPRRILCDFIDSAYLLKKRARVSASGFLGWLGLMEERKTRQWEQAICRRCSCLYISDKDMEATGNLAQVIPNCIVEDGYDAGSNVTLSHPNIAFFGNMAYPPNAEAGMWLARELYPCLQEALPQLQCYIIGRNPDRELQEVCHRQGIQLTGSVENIWDYIQSVDVFAFPLFSGAGLQNKVLEAMYAGKPVVCTSIANEGIGAVDGKHIFIARDRDEFMASIRIAFADNGCTGHNAADFVRKNFSADSVVDRYAALLAE